MHLKVGEADAVALVSILQLEHHLDRARAVRDIRLNAPGTVDLERDRLVAEEERVRSVQPVALMSTGVPGSAESGLMLSIFMGLLRE